MGKRSVICGANFVDIDCLSCFFFSILAVTELTVASYEEDKFGVVQKTLANILTTLLMLQDVSLFYSCS